MFDVCSGRGRRSSQPSGSPPVLASQEDRGRELLTWGGGPRPRRPPSRPFVRPERSPLGQLLLANVPRSRKPQRVTHVPGRVCISRLKRRLSPWTLQEVTVPILFSPGSPGPATRLAHGGHTRSSRDTKLDVAGPRLVRHRRRGTITDGRDGGVPVVPARWPGAGLLPVRPQAQKLTNAYVEG